MGWRNFTGEVNKNSISCKFADIEDFDEIQKLYWDLIEQSKDEPSFPGWKKGVHPSPEMVMESMKQKQMYILKANDVIDNNVAAEAFYKSLGFHYISTENIFYEVVGHRNFKMYEYILSE